MAWRACTLCIYAGVLQRIHEYLRDGVMRVKSQNLLLNLRATFQF